MVSEDYIQGFIDGFMRTSEGDNAEYGSFGDLEWNVPSPEEKEKIKEEIRRKLEE